MPRSSSKKREKAPRKKKNKKQTINRNVSQKVHVEVNVNAQRETKSKRRKRAYYTKHTGLVSSFTIQSPHNDMTPVQQTNYIHARDELIKALREETEKLKSSQELRNDNATAQRLSRLSENIAAAVTTGYTGTPTSPRTPFTNPIYNPMNNVSAGQAMATFRPASNMASGPS